MIRSHHLVFLAALLVFAGIIAAREGWTVKIAREAAR